MADHATTKLCDLAIRELFRPHTRIQNLTTRPAQSLRKAIAEARKFVLEDSMSAFMADLSQVPFHVAEVRRGEALDSLRHGAIPPFPTTWIEFDGHAFRRRLLEVAQNNTDVYGNSLADVSQVPKRWGWLIEQQPAFPHVVRLTEFIDMQGGNIPDYVGGLPFTVLWNTQDGPLPLPADPMAGQLAHGITNYVCDEIGVHLDKGIPEPGNEWRLSVNQELPNRPKLWYTHRLVAEMGGLARYAICLLACINDTPTLRREVKQSRGYLARGNWRKYSDHVTIALNVPKERDTRRLARRIVAMSRRRWHEVRPYWRTYQRGPGELCPPKTHLWSETGADKRQHCTRCSAWRTWTVLPQGRGDPLLGIITHDYKVTHDVH